jgi:hypothetical protein
VGKAFAIGALIASLACGASAFAQTERNLECPPDVKGDPPTVGGPSTGNLSDRLADSRGVICPPAGVDPDIHAKPPEEDGKLKVIPPPGSPGGDPNVRPK